MFERYDGSLPFVWPTLTCAFRIVRPNLDSLVHQLEVAADTMVHRDAADSAADSVVWPLAVAVAVVVKFTCPTSVASPVPILLCDLLVGTYVDLASSSPIL
jgi:hypothetical protein